ncbi:MAG TPA: protein kinase [Solirubrobacteraceae bacterium]|jgi:serine/threonine-protein kinase|nr:protein kinase [Solirubrobacteraceae bacterium]
MADGQVIAGRYELGERLGLGGMSTVQLAFDRRLERDVAVKLLAEHLAEDPQFVSRFRREALAAAQLVHPNIVQVFDFGLDEASGRHYIVMEYIRGQSGAELLRDSGRLAVEEALFVLNQACRGLEHAHRHSVVHRDVKPGNLLRSDEGVVKLADFGIAKAASDTVSRITQVGAVLGTAAYLAPEQAAGDDATARSDIYSLGVVAYQFLSGRLPYEAQSLTELALKQQREVPPVLDELDPAIPHGVAQAVARALEIEPEHRYATADELREALSAGAAGHTLDDEDATTRTSVLAADETLATRLAGPATEQARRPRRLQPAAGPPATALPAGAAAAPAAARGPSRARRALATFLLLALTAAAAVAIYLALASGGGGVQLRDVEREDVPQSVDAMKRLVDDNTR